MTIQKAFGTLLLVASFATPAFCNYSAVNDFPLSSVNPNGAWSYGYETTLNSSFSNHTNYTPNYFGSPSGVEGFYTPLNGNLPTVLKNVSGGNFTYSSIVNWPEDLLLMHPGAAGEYSVVRFTAPTAGTYSVSGKFVGLDIGPTTTDVHATITTPISSLFDGAVNTYGGSGAQFDVTTMLDAGQTIDFAVGAGGNGYYNDSTGFEATITPEPMFYGFLGLALTGMYVVVRFRRARI